MDFESCFVRMMLFFLEPNMNHKWLQILLLSLCLSKTIGAEPTLGWFEPSDAFHKTLEIGNQQTVNVTLKNLEIFYSLNGHTKSLGKIATPFNGKIFIQTADYNYDGLMDLNVFSGYGYMGVNLYSQIFVFDQKTKSYVLAIEGSNLEQDIAQQELVGFEKSGPITIRRRYKIDQSQIYLYEESKPIGECQYERTRYLPSGKIDSSFMDDSNCKPTP